MYKVLESSGFSLKIEKHPTLYVGKHSTVALGASRLLQEAPGLLSWLLNDPNTKVIIAESLV